MNLHEYQAKEILREAGIKVPPFGVAATRTEVERVVRDLKLKEAVIKIQVHAGGRGKAGGVKFAKGEEEIVKVATQLLGMRMVNNQTGPQGVVAHKVLIAPPVEIEKEYYLGAAIDRGRKEAVLIASAEGGMEIEEAAADKILKMPIHKPMRPYQLLELAKFMGWEGKVREQGMELAKRLAEVFMERDGSLLEINPLVLSKGELLALDAKLSVDDNALFRQPEIAAMYDPSQETKNEVIAKEYDLAYIALDGDIGCMVNGAGLAMATMDLIKYAGGRPANFLDVGGSATAEKIAEGFRVLVSDPGVKAILVNIFGGIMNCATIAEGILAVKEGLKVPLVVRMEGTNVEEGKRMLEKMKVLTADGLEEAATMVVKHANLGR
jgi:succinyl-CoA synthetase beta subunit